ncbi:MAG: GNAT family N-acetyltransferase [Myxococcota bacterium]|nr:GNAT family N-acetyltransferase [Myxococcota bacterium]
MKGPPTVETRQLLLRAPRRSDAADLFEIQGDLDAMRHTYVAPDLAATVHRLDAYAARFAEDGFAPWVAVLRSERRIVGWGGLNRDPEAPHWGVEVAYFIHRSYWGRGLAGELVHASLALAFRDLRLPEVVAFTRPANRASRRVLVRAGFVFARHVPELERDRYLVTPQDWKDEASAPALD